jgi:hypothetical protein
MADTSRRSAANAAPTPGEEHTDSTCDQTGDRLDQSGFLDDIGHDTASSALFQHRVTQTGLAMSGDHHKRLTTQRGHRQPTPRGKRMVRRESGDERLLRDRHRAEAGIAERRLIAQRKLEATAVQRSCAQLLHLLLRP